MTYEELLSLVGAGEGAHVEFVRDLQLRQIDKIGPTVVGYLNAGGGYIIAGASVDKSGVVLLGEFDFGYEPKNLEKELRKKITPSAPIFFERVESQGAVFDVVVVPQGKTPPYAYDGVVYVRNDIGHNERASIDVIRDLVLCSEPGEERWENRFALPAPDECIDRSELSSARADCIKAGRVELTASAAMADILGAFSMMRFGRLLNAAIVMFAEHPGMWVPQTKIRLIAFRSDKTDDFDDSRILNGPLCSVVNQAMAFIQTNTRTPGKFNHKDGSRSVHATYPPMAVREALVNACAHREYASAYGGVSVMVYPDRLEIWNSGSLPDGVTVEGLNALKGQRSVLQNPTIADALYVRGFMEQTGRGSVLIPEECKKFGLPSPVWDTHSGVKITFSLPISANGTNGGTNDNQSDAIARAFDEICKNPGIPRKLLISATGYPPRTVQRAVDNLIMQGKIESRGRTRGQGYFQK